MWPATCQRTSRISITNRQTKSLINIEKNYWNSFRVVSKTKSWESPDTEVCVWTRRGQPHVMSSEIPEANMCEVFLGGPMPMRGPNGFGA